MKLPTVKVQETYRFLATLRKNETKPKKKTNISRKTILPLYQVRFCQTSWGVVFYEDKQQFDRKKDILLFYSTARGIGFQYKNATT